MEYVKLLLIVTALYRIVASVWHGCNSRSDKEMYNSVQAILTFSVLILLEVTQ